MELNMISMKATRSIILVLFFFVNIANSSPGDRSFVFQKCLKNCIKTECANESAFKAQQPAHLALLGWTCYAECQQYCMWHTVEAFVRDGSPVPQFYGKWPFVRIFGMQEPASVIFSILNALGHLMILKYRKHVASSTPMYYVWHGQVIVSVNAWLWSTVYHARDTNFTEKMDYFFALSLVMYNMFAFCCRVGGTEKWWKPAATASGLLTLYFRHIYYLSFIHFDYGYNMMFNIANGLVSITLWLTWCVKNRKEGYIWKCAAALLGLNSSMLLELLDFPPLLWILDAHALWHACTAPINVFWWIFVIEDGLFLQRLEAEKKIV